MTSVHKTMSSIKETRRMSKSNQIASRVHSLFDLYIGHGILHTVVKLTDFELADNYQNLHSIILKQLSFDALICM